MGHLRGPFCSPSQPVMGRIYNYVVSWVDGSPVAGRMCIGRQQMDQPLSQRLCVCHAKTGNSSQTIPQATASLSWYPVMETGEQQTRLCLAFFATGLSVNMNNMCCLQLCFTLKICRGGLKDLLNKCCLHLSWMMSLKAAFLNSSVYLCVITKSKALREC